MMTGCDEHVSDTTTVAAAVTTLPVRVTSETPTLSSSKQPSIISLASTTAAANESNATTKTTSLLKRETAAQSNVRNTIVALVISCAIVAIVVVLSLAGVFSSSNDDTDNVAVQPAATTSAAKTAAISAKTAAISAKTAATSTTTTGKVTATPDVAVAAPTGPQLFNSPPATSIPVAGESNVLMSQKAHGTCLAHVMPRMRWNIDEARSDKICCFNRDWAEYSGYWKTTSFPAEAAKHTDAQPMDFFDSVTGDLLFRAPIGRTWSQFIAESTHHGWPSFRDAEVNWNKVRVLPDGETVSVSGTHLGHNLPDDRNRYCINLISVSGRDTHGGGVKAAN